MVFPALFFFWNGVLFGSPGGPTIHYIDQAGLLVFESSSYLLYLLCAWIKMCTLAWANFFNLQILCSIHVYVLGGVCACESRRGHPMPWSWKYRWLEAQDMGTRLGSFAKQYVLLATKQVVQPKLIFCKSIFCKLHIRQEQVPDRMETGPSSRQTFLYWQHL